MIAGVRERLLESVRVRLRADAPICLYLSGGIDSSAIAGIVAHLAPSRKGSVSETIAPVMCPGSNVSRCSLTKIVVSMSQVGLANQNRR